MENRTEDNLVMELVELYETAKNYSNTPINQFFEWSETREILTVLMGIWKNKHETMLEFREIKRKWNLIKKTLERKEQQFSELQKKFEELENGKRESSNN